MPISQVFVQDELSDLVGDLKLPKESAELLAVRLNGKNLHPSDLGGPDRSNC